MRDTVFSPSFGNRPHQLVGRDEIIQLLRQGLTSPRGSRERSLVILGQRGSGKTVLLWEIADLAKQLDYVVATPTITSKDMIDRIVEKVQDSGESSIKQCNLRISGGSISALGFSAGLQFTQSVESTKSSQYKLVQLARRISECGKGLLVLVDELQANSSDIRQLVITYQEMIGEGLNVSLVMAGLPGAVSATLNDKVLTFLNRAQKMNLNPLGRSDIDAYFAKSFRELGINLSEEDRRLAASAVSGSPYLLQLIGHNIVAYADDEGVLRDFDVRTAISDATEDFKNDVCKTTISALSGMDTMFLEAVAKLGSPANIGDVAKALGKTTDYAQKYRTRLIDAGVIESPMRGSVSITVPYLEEFLESRA